MIVFLSNVLLLYAFAMHLENADVNKMHAPYTANVTAQSNITMEKLASETTG